MRLTSQSSLAVTLHRVLESAVALPRTAGTLGAWALHLSAALFATYHQQRANFSVEEASVD